MTIEKKLKISELSGFEPTTWEQQIIDNNLYFERAIF